MTSEKIVAEILAGRHDGKLADIQQAMRERVLSQATSMRWKITHPEVEVTEDDLTLEEAELIERVTGQSWAQIDPYASAIECRAILTVCLQKRAGKSTKEAADITGKLTVTATTDMLSSYEVTAGPLGASAPGVPEGEPEAKSSPDGEPPST